MSSKAEKAEAQEAAAANTLQTMEKHYEMINKILHHFAGDKFNDELSVAKKEFFENAGILEENSPQFELRMTQFFDWYFFSRKLRSFGQTPLESVFNARELRYSDEEISGLSVLKDTKHSLYEFLKFKNGDIHIKDLLRNEKIVVANSPWIYGFERDEIFEARLIPYNDGYIFAKGFCFHPHEARKFILGEVKRHRKNPDLDQEEFILRLVKMKYKAERYKHVKIEKIYADENLVGL